MKAIVHFSLLTALLGSAACDSSSELDFKEPPQGTLHTIGELKSLCSSDSAVLAQDISVRGNVTANDHFGEFPRTLIIEDTSGALRIAIDHAALYRQFPIGCEVTVQCNGLALGTYGGTVLLGAEPDAAYGVTRIPAADIARHIRCEGQGTEQAPATLTFEDVSATYISAYVRFEGVRFEEAATWCDTDPGTHRPVTTERTIVDARGRTFPVRTAGTCSYATEPVPSGTGSVCGIIDCFNGRYSLCITARQIFFSTSAGLPTAYP